jgi:hypothetical protein
MAGEMEQVLLRKFRNISDLSLLDDLRDAIQCDRGLALHGIGTEVIAHRLWVSSEQQRFGLLRTAEEINGLHLIVYTDIDESTLKILRSVGDAVSYVRDHALPIHLCAGPWTSV